MKKHSLLVLLLISTLSAYSQALSGTLKGTIIDDKTEQPIPYANIVVISTEPKIGTTSNDDGTFTLDGIPIGRHDVSVSFIGYETKVLTAVLVNSNNNPLLKIRLREKTNSLNDIVLKAKLKKEKPKNNMATVSAKQISMEEASRFAGGFDDPARLVSSYAGVASNIGTNEIVVRGNSPKGVLWQMEGVPITNPNHFAEISGFGGGGITALSGKMLANSDFYTSAFPAEYGNAISSVFDLAIRDGNNREYNHSIQAGFLGLDVASEGPFSKNYKGSYLFNYRYSTLGLIDVLIPDSDLGITYQDFSFKINLPTKKMGSFSIWGLGLIDQAQSSPDADTNEVDSKWQYYEDISTENSKQSTGILGLNHKIYVGKKGYLKTTATIAYSSIFSETSRLDSSYKNSYKTDEIDYITTDYRLSSVINLNLSQRHTNRTGFILTNLNYDFNLQEAPSFGTPLVTFANDNGQSSLVQVFSQSAFSIGRFKLNPGVHFMFLTLNNNYSIEPRVSASYLISENNSIGFGYGLHSQLEKLSYYLSNTPNGSVNQQLNKNLNFSKSHHFVLAYDHMFTENLHLKIEPYYQYLFDIPVINNSYFSLINLTDDFFINEPLVNNGTGINMGVDITFERFLNKGWYYLTTLSLFDSKYKGGDGIERNTTFNRQFISNILIGKEWLLKEKKLLNVSFKYTLLGGNRIHPIDRVESINQMEVVEDLSKPYSVKNPTSHVASFTITYRINKAKYTSFLSLQILNILGAKEYLGYQYNFRNNSMDANTDIIVVPNLSYRIEF